MDEIQENHREDGRKLVEMMQKEEEDQEGQRGRVAPDMGAGGSHTQAMSVPDRRETRRMRWADCENVERKEEEEREQDTEKETKQEIGQEELTSEKPPGLEQKEESEHERKEEEEKRVQEAREEEKRAQEAREEQKRSAQEAQERRRRQSSGGAREK